MDEATPSRCASWWPKVPWAVGCISTDDARKSYAELKERGAELTEEPTERPYGIDFGLRDPFGNAIRIGQLNRPQK